MCSDNPEYVLRVFHTPSIAISVARPVSTQGPGHTFSHRRFVLNFFELTMRMRKVFCDWSETHGCVFASPTPLPGAGCHACKQHGQFWGAVGRSDQKTHPYIRLFKTHIKDKRPKTPGWRLHRHGARRGLAAKKCGTFFMTDLWLNGKCRYRVAWRNPCHDVHWSGRGFSQELCTSCLLDYKMCA